MSAASDSDTPEIALLKAQNRALRSEIDNLVEEVRGLRWQLAEAPWVQPYDQTAAALTVLTDMLRGWPSKPWRELAGLIERRAASCGRAP